MSEHREQGGRPEEPPRQGPGPAGEERAGQVGPEEPPRQGPGPAGPQEGPGPVGPEPRRGVAGVERDPGAAGSQEAVAQDGSGLERIRVVRPGCGQAARPRSRAPFSAAAQPPAYPGPGGGARPVRRAGDPGAGDPAGQELRVLLQRAVGGLEPAPGALERLRTAVPRRRVRRRQAVGGSVALLVLLGIAVPVLNMATASSVRVTAGSSGGLQQAGTSWPGLPGGAQSGSQALPGPLPAGSPTASLLPGGSGVVQSWGYSGGTGSSTPPGSAATSSATSLPECTRGQLGAGRAALGRPDADGTVYGVFWVTNVSSRSCAVSSPGTVAVTAAQGTDPSRIRVQMHTSADPATALPDPQSAPAAVALQPSSEYQVDFAWVPDSGNAACAGQASAAAGPADAGTAGTAGSGGSGSGTNAAAPAASAGASPTSSGGGTGSGAPGVTLGHTPGAGGAPAASVSIGGACSGTVYRTEPLPVAGASGSGSPSPGATAAGGSGAAAPGGSSG